jgi:hypothetical protein
MGCINDDLSTVDKVFSLAIGYSSNSVFLEKEINLAIGKTSEQFFSQMRIISICEKSYIPDLSMSKISTPEKDRS